MQVKPDNRNETCFVPTERGHKLIPVPTFKHSAAFYEFTAGVYAGRFQLYPFPAGTAFLFAQIVFAND